MTATELSERYPQDGFYTHSEALAWIADAQKLHQFRGTVFWTEPRDGRYVVVQGLPWEKPS